MQIPPVSPIQPGLNPSPGNLIDQFYALWQSWYQNPTQAGAQQLIDFLNVNKDKLQALADKKPAPFPRVSFENALDTSLTYLQGWMEHDGSPVGASEFLNDIYLWVAYAR